VNPWLKRALLDELKHFCSSASFSGLAAVALVWLSTRITSWASGSRVSRLRGRTWRHEQVDRFIYPLLWSAALFVSFLAHCILDGLLG